MNEKEVFVLADRALLRVVEQIDDSQWWVKVPSWLMRDPNERPTLREVINYHAYDDAWVPDMLAGKTMDEAGKTRFDGDLLKDDPKGNFAQLVERACAAVEALDDLDRTVHCSFGDFKAREYLWQINSFRGLRARDLAIVIGVDDTLPEPLVQGLWDELKPHAEEWRKLGVFGPEIEVPETASLQVRLMALTGRP